MNIREMMRKKNAMWIEEQKQLTEAKEEEKKTRQETQQAWNGAMRERRKAIKLKHKGIVYSRTVRPDKKDFLKLNSGEILVETAGFIPIQEQVKRFERAGMNLRAEMEKKYDYGPIDGDNDGFKDTHIEQYPDNIESFDIIQDVKIAQLKAKMEAVKNAETKLREKEKILPDVTPDEPTEPTEPPAGD